jgi:GTP cyclohydrolase I
VVSDRELLEMPSERFREVQEAARRSGIPLAVAAERIQAGAFVSIDAGTGMLISRGTGDSVEYDEHVEELATEFLKAATGLDTGSEHGARTPARFAKMLMDLTTPMPIDFTVFPASNDEMVTMTNIPFYSLCNHHLAPFFGVAHVAYIPDQLIVGLSKLARTVRETAKDLSVQEDMTSDIADFLDEKLLPKGVAVVVEARHLCMEMRGVGVAGATTTTSSMRGVFADHSRTAKAEFMQIVAMNRKGI